MNPNNKKYAYYDIEICNDPSLIGGWKAFKSMGFSVGIILVNDVYEEYYSVVDMYNRLKELILNNYILVGFNSIKFDNNIIAHQCGILDVEEYLNLPIGGSGKNADVLWKDVDDNYLVWLVKNKAGNYIVAEAMCKYRDGIKDNSGEKINDIKKLLDDNSLDIMKLIDDKIESEYSVGLDAVCYCTVNARKSKEGDEVYALLKENKLNEVKDYCINDVKILYKLHRFIQLFNYVLIPQYKQYFMLTEYIVLKIKL